MKTTKKQLNSLFTILLMLILFQGCTVYQIDIVSLDQAMKQQKKVKIITVDGHKLNFKKIVFQDDKYEGIKNLKDNSKDVYFLESDIKCVRFQDKASSVLLSFSPVVLFLLMYIIFTKKNNRSL